MKICIDARYLSSSPSGIGRYCKNLIRELGNIDQVNEYVVFVHDSYSRPREIPENFRYEAVPHRPLSFGTLLQMGSRIDRERADLAHILYSVIPLRLRTPLIITLHDWQPLTVPNFSGARPLPIKWAYDRFYRWHYPHAVRKARAVIADSEYTGAETLRWAPLAAEKCSVIHLGLEPEFFDPPAAGDLEKVTPEKGFPQRFILYVGSTRPNKQIPTLIRAFAQLQKSRPDLADVGLVLALTIDRFFAESEKLINDLHLREKIKVVPEAGDEILRALYARASIVSMATTDEGFGFPVLEAMAQGAPVVIADHGSLPEVAGGAALSVAPVNPSALAEAFARLLRDGDLRARLSREGLKRCSEFSWRRTAEATLKIYESLR